MNPWGVEPQSKEPESFILSIELRVQVVASRGEGDVFLWETRVQNYGIFCNFATVKIKNDCYDSTYRAVVAARPCQ